MGITKKSILFLFIILFSCKSFQDSLIQLPLKNYDGSNLRIDGYYIGRLQGRNMGMSSIYFFYQNGIILYGGGFQTTDSLLEKEDKFKSKLFNSSIKKSKTGWGVFQVQGNKIEFEIWEPSSGGSLKTSVRSGKIISDTVFVIDRFYNNYNSKLTIENDTFFFKNLNFKPDSTNTFIN